MSERREYEMTAAQLATILDACKPTPVMFLSGGRPMYDTPQENANRALITNAMDDKREDLAAAQ